MAKFHKGIDALKQLLLNNGLNGNWSDTASLSKFTTTDGANLTFYKNGTLLSQGKGSSKQKIDEIISSLDGATQSPASMSIPIEKPVPQLFIVYGHDETSRDQLELILTKIGIEPFILAKSSGNGQTIIEALENKVGKNGTSTAGIVLLTADDKGYAIRDGEDKIKGRARQNVILEMGMLISKLGRSNTIILVKGSLERPSDTDGIIYHSFESHVKETVRNLVDRLTHCGFDIDHKKALEAGR